MAHHNSTDDFSELLNPVKDPERSFAINISELLQNYVRSFVEGSVNFNSAALMIQGSASIYGKKVEYLHNLATKLYASLLKNRKDDVAKKDTKEKEKHSKENKFNDPFCSTEIKLGKNLSCLRKKFSAKNAPGKKASKKSDKKYTYVPVDLVPIEDKGKDNEMEIIDVEGKSLGKKNTFTLNKCKVTASGWLLLPTTSPDLIPSESSSPDYTLEDEVLDDNICNDFDSHMPDSSPLDEGYPPSTGESNTPASNLSSQPIPSSQGTDEGLGSLPCTPLEMGSQSVPSTPAVDENAPTTAVSPSGTLIEGIQRPDGFEGNENIPLEDADVAPRPRRSMRQALKICQLQEGEAPNPSEENPAAKTEREVAVVKKAIQKKNTYNLPTKLKSNEDSIALYPASEFCARTFFSMDRTYSKSLPHCIEVCAFQNHSKLSSIFQRLQTSLSAINQKKKDKAKNGTPATEDDESADVDIENDEVEDILDEPATHDDIAVAPLEAADIVIENNNGLPIRISDNENPLAEDEPMFASGGEPMFAESIDDELGAFNEKELEDSFTNAARLQCDLFREEMQQYVQTSDISERVNAWEATMKPFLEELNKREEFDIDLYGSRILNAFQESNRKQTITFRDFCKGLEKWQIHRYFMALLPLVNIGNVSIESEKISEDEEDILVTLLSRKMHHKELEEFGHNEGEHS